MTLVRAIKISRARVDRRDHEPPIMTSIFAQPLPQLRFGNDIYECVATRSDGRPIYAPAEIVVRTAYKDAIMTDQFAATPSVVADLTVRVQYALDKLIFDTFGQTPIVVVENRIRTDRRPDRTQCLSVTRIVAMDLVARVAARLTS